MAEVFSGARARFKINGIQVAYAGGVSAEEMVDYQPVDVLGLLEVREWVPVAYRCSLSAQVFRVVGSPLKKFGEAGVSIFPKQDDILTSGDLTASLEDTLNTGSVVASFEQVKAAGHTWDTGARGIVSENISFVAIRTKDEAEV